MEKVFNRLKCNNIYYEIYYFECDYKLKINEPALEHFLRQTFEGEKKRKLICCLDEKHNMIDQSKPISWIKRNKISNNRKSDKELSRITTFIYFDKAILNASILPLYNEKNLYLFSPKGFFNLLDLSTIAQWSSPNLIDPNNHFWTLFSAKDSKRVEISEI
jgi:hypothetical protein